MNAAAAAYGKFDQTMILSMAEIVQVLADVKRRAKRSVNSRHVPLSTSALRSVFSALRPFTFVCNMHPYEPSH